MRRKLMPSLLAALILLSYQGGWRILPESAGGYYAGEQVPIESPGGMAVYLQIRKPAITLGESHMGDLGSGRFNRDALSQAQPKYCVGRNRQPQ